MDKKDTEKRIIKVIKNMGFEADADSNLYDIGMDILDIVNLVMELEKEFQIEIDDEKEKILYDKPYFSVVLNFVKNAI